MAASCWIGIDWGTTHRRAWCFAETDRIMRFDDDQGLIAVAPHFAASLVPLLRQLDAGAADAPIVMAGMVGAASGWQEAPYLDAATSLARLPEHLQRLTRPDAPPRAWIVPGVRWRGENGAVDVMRGEETQLYGAMQLLGTRSDGWYLLPGTHSKWVSLRAGCVTSLRTYLSGELFALLQDRGTLAALMRSQAAPAGTDSEHTAFEHGIDAAAQGALSHALFAARARAVTGALASGDVAAFVSGALFGAEWHDMAPRVRDVDCVRLLGDPRLCARHAACAGRYGLKTELIDPEAAQRAAWEQLRKAGPE